MDSLNTLYERLRRRAGVNLPASIETPPLLEDWLRHWNDAAPELGRLRNFEPWLSRSSALRAKPCC